MAAASFGGCAVIGSIAVGVAYAQTKVPSQKQLVMRSSQASTVYFSNGKPVDTFGNTKHVVLAYNQIPAVMREAAVAAEDKNFYHEGGVSITGILRAAYYDFTSSGGNLQGASTITEQLVKQAYEGLSTQATNGSTLSSGVSNKIKEVFISEKLAQEKSKAWIITQYLNTVPLGRATGVGAAAEAYFGIPASKLDTAQAAMLAAMFQSPGYYNPDPKAGAAYKALVTRWRTHVLATMVQMGDLTPQAAAKLQFPKVTALNNSWDGQNGYIMQRVQYELATYWHVSMQKAFTIASTSGLKIYTTYNEHLMNSLRKVVAHNNTLMKHCNPPQNSTIGGGNAVLSGYKCTHRPSWVHVGAVLEQPGTGAILAEYGGPGYQKNQLDYAMASYNQVGSSFKPYVLSAAVKQGMNAMNSIMNGYSPLWIPPVGSQPPVYAKRGSYNGNQIGPAPKGVGSQWYPVVNDEAVPSQGPVSVQKSMAESLNTAYTALYSRVGGQAVMKTAREFGVDTGTGTALASHQNEVGEALGQGSLTVLEQATMITTLANNGTYVEPHAIKKIVEGSRVMVPKVATHQVLTQQQTAEVDWALSQDTTPNLGTAPGDGLTNNQVVIAKTGTTNLAQSGFFLGAIPKAAMAVGMFVQNPSCPKHEQKQCKSYSSLNYAPPKGLETLFGVGGLAGYGGGWPATIWHDFFMENYNNLAPQAWPTPPSNLGQKWNLVGPIHHHHKKHTSKPTPTPTGICHGRKACQQSPSPTPTLTNPAPTPSPTCSYTFPNNKQSCTSPSPTTSATPTSSSSTTAGMVVGDRRWSWATGALL